MMLDRLTDMPWWVWACVAFGLLIAQSLRFRYQSGLNKYNGPFLASITDFWRMWQAYWYIDRMNYEGLPEKYGKIVRLGPKTLLFTEPDAIKDIYTKGFSKSESYMTAAGVSRGVVVPNLFSSADKEWHGKVRRSVSNAFALSTLIQYEPLVSEVITKFLHEIDARIADKPGNDGVVDFSQWSNYFALDVISQLTFSASYGLLDAGCDEIGIIRSRYDLTRYFFVLYNMPWLDFILYKNPILLWLGKHGLYNKVTPTVPFAQRELSARLRLLSDGKGGVETGRVDLLEKFLQAKEAHPDAVDDRTVLGLTLSMVNAGSGTISTALSALIYHLLKNPASMNKLLEELDSHFPPSSKEKKLAEYDVVSFGEAQKLPYLDACLKETFRIHPSLGGQLLERVVPEGGAHVAGEFIHGGTIVSSNAWVVHRHKPTFGDDVDCFRPERWLESDSAQLSAMNRSLLTFGAGPHTCIGKNIGLLELYKVVPSLLRTFTIQLQDQEATWKVRNLREPHCIFVRFERRYKMEKL